MYARLARILLGSGARYSSINQTEFLTGDILTI